MGEASEDEDSEDEDEDGVTKVKKAEEFKEAIEKDILTVVDFHHSRVPPFQFLGKIFVIKRIFAPTRFPNFISM